MFTARVCVKKCLRTYVIPAYIIGKFTLCTNLEIYRQNFDRKSPLRAKGYRSQRLNMSFFIELFLGTIYIADVDCDTLDKVTHLYGGIVCCVLVGVFVALSSIVIILIWIPIKTFTLPEVSNY